MNAIKCKFTDQNFSGVARAVWFFSSLGMCDASAYEEVKRAQKRLEKANDRTRGKDASGVDAPREGGAGNEI